QTMISSLFPAILAAVGFMTTMGMVFKSELLRIAGLGVTSAFIAGFPFVGHIGAPGVDSQAYSLFSWFIGTDRGFPLIDDFGSQGVVQHYLATAGNDALAALLMRIWSVDAGLAQLYLSVAWVAATMMAALVVIRAVSP